MPLEQEVVRWAKTRPPWQQYILRRIARGETLMDSDYEQIVEAILASEDFENEQLSIEDLPCNVGRR